MAVTHLTITAAKKPQIGTMSVSMNNGRREGGEDESICHAEI